MRLLFVAVVVVVAQASTIPPSLPDSTTAAPIDVTDTGAPVTDTVAPVTDTAAPGIDVTTDNPSTGTDASTAVPSNVTMIPADCNPSLVQIQSVIDFSNTAEFQKLSENQQIVVYELLAAAEACRIKEFITPETAQRIFLLLEGGYTAVYGSASESGYTAMYGSAAEGGYTAVYGSAAEGGYTAVYGSAAEGGYTAVYGSAAEGGYTAVYGSAAEGGYKAVYGSAAEAIVQELCESRGGRPGLSVLTSLLVSRGRKDLLHRASALVTTCP